MRRVGPGPHLHLNSLLYWRTPGWPVAAAYNWRLNAKPPYHLPSSKPCGPRSSRTSTSPINNSYQINGAVSAPISGVGLQSGCPDELWKKDASSVCMEVVEKRAFGRGR